MLYRRVDYDDRLTKVSIHFGASAQVSALLALHGSKADLQIAGLKCLKMLDQDIRTFVDLEPHLPPAMVRFCIL